MSPECEFYPKCQEERTENSEFKGYVKATLEDIDTGVKNIWTAIDVSRNDIKSLYFKVGLISGGTSLIVSLVVSFIFKK